MKLSHKYHAAPMPSVPLGVATDRHSAPMHSEQPGTTGEIVGAQTHLARQEVATVPPIAPMHSEQLGTTGK